MEVFCMEKRHTFSKVSEIRVTQPSKEIHIHERSKAWRDSLFGNKVIWECMRRYGW